MDINQKVKHINALYSELSRLRTLYRTINKNPGEGDVLYKGNVLKRITELENKLNALLPDDKFTS
jgi:hypothetical protein